MTPRISPRPKSAWIVALSATNEAFFGLGGVGAGGVVPQ
jgi:hypothetical protein